MPSQTSAQGHGLVRVLTLDDADLRAREGVRAEAKLPVPALVVDLDRVHGRADEESDKLERDGGVLCDVLTALVLPNPRVFRVLLPSLRAVADTERVLA